MDQHTIDRPKMSPKDFFMYFGVAVTLYASAGSLLALLFAVINARFQDALDGYYAYGGAVSALQFSVSTLLVVFPVFLVLSWLIRKDIVAHAEKAQLAIRKWFVWLTLFLAGATIAGDLIALLRVYMGGEITTRFIWKMFAVFAVALAIFGYYLYDLRRASRGDQRVNKPLIAVAALGVLAAVVLGFVTIGSPKEQRMIRLDTQRASDLASIQWEVLNHWQSKKVLPQSLETLPDDFTGYRIPADPETGEAYEYRVTGPLSFELCATFVRSNMHDGSSKLSYPRDPWGPDASFEHEVGRTCFERTIDAQKWTVVQ